jgi:hypothetical protein
MMVAMNTAGNRIPVGRRREAFRALVESQDRGSSIPDSRREVGERYDLTEVEVRAVEREGIDHDWPPL